MNPKNLLASQLSTSSYSSLYSIRDNQSLIKRLKLTNKLEVHSGCVNTISWSDNDQSIVLSGSDDQNLCISNAFTGQKKCLIHTGHKTNIFCAKFLPKSNDEKIISCSSGGDIYLSDINYPTIINNQNHYACHGDKTCYELRTCYDPFNFTSCGLDGAVKWFDIRQSSKCTKSFCQEHTLLKISNGISTISINPIIPYHLVCGGLDGILRLYDRRMLSVGSFNSDNQSLLLTTSQSAKGLFACFNPNISNSNETANLSGRFSVLNATMPNNKRITSVQYDNSGYQILVSYQSDLIYLLDWRDLTEDKEEIFENVNKNLTYIGITQEGTSSNLAERKFRIQSDWSDTGPNSMPYNEMENNDPRSFLARRLSEWFGNLTNNRTQNRALNVNLNTVPNRSTLSSIPSESNSNESSTETNANKTSETNEQTSSEDDNETDNNQSTNQNDSRRENFLSLTTSFIGSRLRTKQASRLENNVIKSKPSPRVKMVFSGHRNARTIIKECNFWGHDFVMSGSDCGHVFFWDKKTGKIINVLEADKHVVNCVQENSVYPVLASSGIDYNIKIWEPLLDVDPVDYQKIEQITKRNKLMLEESKNTVYIPVQFMIPALRMFGANMGMNTRNSNSNSTNLNEPNQNN